MRKITGSVAILLLTSGAHASIQLTSYQSSWSSRATILRAITLGGGTDQLGDGGELPLGSFARHIVDSGQVVRDHATIDSTISVDAQPDRIRWNYSFSAFGAMEHPQAADNGQLRMDFSSSLRMTFSVAAPQEFYMEALMEGDHREIWIETADHTRGYGFYGSGVLTGVLEPGDYILGVIYTGPSLFNTTAHPPGELSPLEYHGVCNFAVIFPSPATASLGLLGLIIGTHRRRPPHR